MKGVWLAVGLVVGWVAAWQAHEAYLGYQDAQQEATEKFTAELLKTVLAKARTDDPTGNLHDVLSSLLVARGFIKAGEPLAQ